MDDDEDEYDAPEPSRTVVSEDGNFDCARPILPGHTHIVDKNGKKIVSMYIPSQRMRILEDSDALWMDLAEVMEDVAVAFRRKVTREEFLKAAEDVLHIIKK